METTDYQDAKMRLKFAPIAIDTFLMLVNIIGHSAPTRQDGDLQAKQDRPATNRLAEVDQPPAPESGSQICRVAARL
jgi:hypothetical protein